MTQQLWPTNRRVNPLDLAKAKLQEQRWAMLTSYDVMTAGLFETAGVRALLVGDTSSMVVYGHPTTLEVTLDEIISLAGGVVRGTNTAMVIGDMPFGTYHSSPQQALNSAVRLVKEAGVQAVKLEGGLSVAPQIEMITKAGIPVIGHIGLTPQSIHSLGGYKVQGRGKDADLIFQDAQAVEKSGAIAIVLEAVPASLAKRITERLSIPTIGVGAGPHCDAQVLVWQDMVGLTSGKTAKFVKKYADLHTTLTQATSDFVNDVEKGTYPGPEHSYEDKT